MKLSILDSHKKKTGEQELPVQFNEEFRPNLIKRAVLSLQSRLRQQYGASPEAGLRHSASLSKRRRKYRGCYGFGISRVARKIHSRRGTRMFWVGTFSPQTVGGRRAHAPKSEKIFAQKINKKENQKAIRSAIAATIVKDLVSKRGHKIPVEYPFLLDDSVETLSKTQDVLQTLKELGFNEELVRSSVKKVRAGKGKSRGRKFKRKKGILIVTKDNCQLLKSAKNIPGLDIVPVKSLNANILAPGALAGRVTLFTAGAVEIMNKEGLFRK